MSYLNEVTLHKQQLYGSGAIVTTPPYTISNYRIRNSDPISYLINQDGTGTFTVNTTAINMAVTSGQYCIVSSKSYHIRLNDKSLLVLLAVAGMGSASNVEKSIGYMSSSATAPYNTGLDGFRIFKDVSNNYFVEVWRNGSLVTQIARSAWTDPLDGTGASGININFSRYNVFQFEVIYDTLIGYITFNGQKYEFVEYVNTNVGTNCIFLSGNKPIRYEIRSTTGSGNMDFNECGVSIAGSLDNLYQSVCISSSDLGLSLALAGTTYALVGVRKRTTHRDRFALIKDFEGMIKTNDWINFSIILNPTVAGVFNYTDLANTPFQTATGILTNIVTGGTVLHKTSTSLNMNNSKNVEGNVLARLGCTLNNTMDSIVLCGSPSLGSGNVLSTANINVNWIP